MHYNHIVDGLRGFGSKVAHGDAGKSTAEKAELDERGVSENPKSRTAHATALCLRTGRDYRQRRPLPVEKREEGHCQPDII